MISITKGKTITATDVHTGSGKNGDWWMCKVKADKGYNSITLWCNGCTAKEGDVVTIEDITDVKKGRRQSGEKWYDTFDVNVVLSAASADFAELPDEDSDLPF